MKSMWLVRIACISLGLVAATAHGTTYNLSPADDWYSVINGEGLLPGDEVVLASGTYTVGDTQTLTLGHVGTADQPITIRAADGATPIITRNTFGAYNDIYNLQHNTINIRGAQYLVLHGLTITGGNWGIRIGSKTSGLNITNDHPMGDILRPARNITVEYCNIHHTHNTAISANFPGDTYENLVFRHNEISYTARYGEAFYFGNYSSYIMGIVKNSIVENNYIHDQASPWYVDPAFSDYHGTGIQFKDGSYGNIMRDNVICNTNYPGILITGTTASAYSGSDITPNVMEGNVILEVTGGTTGQGIQVAAGAILRNNIVYAVQPILSQIHQSSVPGNLQMINNTVISRGSDTIKIANTPNAPILIANNALYRGAGSSSVITGNGSSSTWVTKVANVAILNLANDIVNASGFNFFPTVGSSLRNAANTTYQSANDFNGSLRGIDLTCGAYAYSATGNPGWTVQYAFKQLRLLGDIDADSAVNLADLKLLVGAWNSMPASGNWNPAADIDNDTNVNLADLKILVANWNQHL